MTDSKKLFLLDAYALIFRAYYAFINRPIRNSAGLNTSAIFGFINTLEEVLRKEKPSHVAVAFDPPGPTFRHKMYNEYKANRDETPEDIRKSVPYIKEFIKAFNIPIVEEMGYEADDVIGTLAKQAEKEGYQVYMMTPDKDYAQLVTENVFMYKPRKSGGEVELLGNQEVKEIFGIQNTLQVIDILALMGDSADNVPGAPGIGPKTAQKLIAKYHSVEELLESTAELKGKQKENLENFRDQILLSKKLVTIDTHVPINQSIDSFGLKDPQIDTLSSLLDEMEFKALKNRLIKPQESQVQTSLFGEIDPIQNNEVRSFDTFDKSKVNYEFVSDENLEDFINSFKPSNSFCLDTETTGLNVHCAEIVGLALCSTSSKAFYIPFKGSKEETRNKLSKLKYLFVDQSLLKIGHNLKYDIQILNSYGIEVEGPYFDTMIAHYLLHPESKHKLDNLSEKYFQYQMIPIEDLIGIKGKSQKNMRDIDPKVVKDYACEDADITYRLFEIFSEELEENDLMKLASTVEMPLLKVLSDMEIAGFNLDTKSLNEYDGVLVSEIEDTKRKIYQEAGQEFNISSPKQLGEILFDKLKITNDVKKTKTKQYSTSEDVLIKLIDKHAIVKLVLEYRSLTKLHSTYVHALPQLIEPSTGRIHSSFNQTIAATGRLSSINPNLQNIPIRDQRGKEIRKSFIPADDEHVLLAADYSQIELRIMAALSQDEHMIQAFSQGADIHRATAAKIYKVDEEEVSQEMRSKAKTANFGIIYGISAFGLAQRLSIPRKEAKELIDNYLITFPGVKKFMEESIVMAKQNLFVKTLFGRKRYLPDIQSSNSVVRGYAERNAINSPIQGTAADIIKIAMIQIHRRLKHMRSKMISQVHDELIFDVYKPELEEVKAIVKSEMENAAQLDVPLTVEMGIGMNWAEAH